jgi:hypothetical protein
VKKKRRGRGSWGRRRPTKPELLRRDADAVNLKDRSTSAAMDALDIVKLELESPVCWESSYCFVDRHLFGRLPEPLCFALLCCNSSSLFTTSTRVTR